MSEDGPEGDGLRQADGENAGQPAKGKQETIASILTAVVVGVLAVAVTLIGSNPSPWRIALALCCAGLATYGVWSWLSSKRLNIISGLALLLAILLLFFLPSRESKKSSDGVSGGAPSSSSSTSVTSTSTTTSVTTTVTPQASVERDPGYGVAYISYGGTGEFFDGELRVTLRASLEDVGDRAVIPTLVIAAADIGDNEQNCTFRMVVTGQNFRVYTKRSVYDVQIRSVEPSSDVVTLRRPPSKMPSNPCRKLPGG
jgi:hypothetical protein